MTRKEVMEEIIRKEKKREFDHHVDPINYDICLPVDEKFQYIKRGWTWFKVLIQNIFIVKPFIFYINKLSFRKVKVIGKKNLKGVKRAILTCNHVDMFDCLVVKGNVKPKRLFITAAEFNNFSGFLGEMMRAGGMWPMSSKLKAIRNFNDAIEKRLNDNCYILFYPEQSMWWHYEKPRPFKDGAFHYAVKHNVPVIPCFITYRDTNKKDKEGIMIRRFTLNIMKPIYPQKGLTKKENIEFLKETDYKACVDVYEKTYQKKLEFEK